MEDKEIKKIIKYVKDDLVVKDLLKTKREIALFDRTVLLTMYKTMRYIWSLREKPRTTHSTELETPKNKSVKERNK